MEQESQKEQEKKIALQRKKLERLARQRRGLRKNRRKMRRQAADSSGHSKINNITAAFLLTIAALVDLTIALINILHLIPVVGNVLAFLVATSINVLIWLTFYVWLKIKGVNLISPKKAIAMAGSGLLGFIPGLSALPNWTLAITIVILLEKKESLPVVSKVRVS